jgi:alkanesulfonate monooxygenase SsuD/methylene tetrahydromethanopterin reductase-like flavin-dependent oxidoreductase (luciferase family)
MATIDFGFMLKPYGAEQSMHEVMAFNQHCIQALSAGFTTLWVEDHLQWGAVDTLESVTTLSYLAAMYPQFKVGTLVLSQSYRNPALLAKMAANLQALSGGRVILGLGAGWKEDEYHAYGYPFPPVKTRMEQLEEAAQILRMMWRTQPATFKGKHYHIQNAYCAPQPSPMIPLLIGGGGEQRTLALVARYADWWNFNSVNVETYAHKLSILKQHCERIGRDPAEIKLTYLATASVSENPNEVVRSPQKHFVAGNAAEVTRELEEFCALGVTHFVFRFLDVASVERFVTTVVPNFV